MPLRASAGLSPAYRRILTGAWLILLLIGAFYVFASISDLVADARTGLPSDHATTFATVAGIGWPAARQSAPGLTMYVTLLEVAYAVHELVFGILFLVIVAIPFREGRRWAWWACWPVMLANLTYSIAFGRHDATLLQRSLIADIGVPVILLIFLPACFGLQRRQKALG